jgi:hypothetical protein
MSALRVNLTAIGVLVLFGTPVTLGCAHGPEREVAPPDPAAAVQAAPQPEHVYRPVSRLEARDMLESAFEAISDGDHARAADLFSAVLATDFLTDEGRADLYWMKAEAHRRMDDPAARTDALGSFLLSSELVPPTQDLLTRRLLARSALVAMKVADDPGFGRSPETPITVQDVREPASIMASLSCGPSGRGHYVDIAIRSVKRAGDDSSLVQRRAECHPSGHTLELWFDLSQAQAAAE